MARPALATMWQNFLTIYGNGTLPEVGDRIGGKFKLNIDMGLTDPTAGFQNGCAIRMSYTLNYSGVTIPRGPWKTVTGADGKRYIYRVADLLRFLRQRFGTPDRVVEWPEYDQFTEVQGLMVFEVDFSDATGHATLWNGSDFSDHGYFSRAKRVSLWQLP